MAYQFGQLYKDYNLGKSFSPVQYSNYNFYNQFQNINPNMVFSNLNNHFRGTGGSPQNYIHHQLNNSPNSLEQNMILIKPRIREQIRTPKCKSIDGKKFLVLDLDETVVLSSTIPPENYQIFKCVTFISFFLMEALQIHL